MVAYHELSANFRGWFLQFLQMIAACRKGQHKTRIPNKQSKHSTSNEIIKKPLLTIITVTADTRKLLSCQGKTHC